MSIGSTDGRGELISSKNGQFMTPQTPTALYPLGHEIAKVQAEILAFRNEYLPVFMEISRTPELIPPIAFESQQNTFHLLSSWQDAITKVADALPLPGDSAKFNQAEFKDFMFCEGTPGYSLLNNSISWKIGMYCDIRIAILSGYRPPDLGDNENFTEDDFWTAIPQIETWLLSLNAMDGLLWNPLCMTLPFIADVDPDFAQKALDLNTWGKTNPWFEHVVNNALLHVLASLANNHFMRIQDYLGHPCLLGRYTRLMPHYLFSVLFHKVLILRQLATDQPPTDCCGNSE